MDGKGREGQRQRARSVDVPCNAGTRRSPDRVGDAEYGRRVNVAVLWCRIVLRVELEIIGEERGGVLKNVIVAIGGCRRLLDGE